MTYCERRVSTDLVEVDKSAYHKYFFILTLVVYEKLTLENHFTHTDRNDLFSTLRIKNLRNDMGKQSKFWESRKMLFGQLRLQARTQRIFQVRQNL